MVGVVFRVARPDAHRALQLPKQQSPGAWLTTTTSFGFYDEVLVQVTHWLMVKSQQETPIWSHSTHFR